MLLLSRRIVIGFQSKNAFWMVLTRYSWNILQQPLKYLRSDFFCVCFQLSTAEVSRKYQVEILSFYASYKVWCFHLPFFNEPLTFIWDSYHDQRQQIALSHIVIITFTFISFHLDTWDQSSAFNFSIKIFSIMRNRTIHSNFN